MKNTLRIGAVAAVSALALAACSSAPEDEATTSTSGAPESSATAAPAVDFLPCMVSDTGGFDDNSFNEIGYTGLKKAADELGVEPIAVESASDADFAPNLQSLADQGCDLIVSVGFLLSAATVEAALANPDVEFAIIDDAADNDFDGTIDAPNTNDAVPVLRALTVNSQLVFTVADDDPTPPALAVPALAIRRRQASE